MKKRTILPAVLITLLLSTNVSATEIMPFLKKTGIGGVDFKVYTHNSRKNGISMTNELPLSGFTNSQLLGYSIVTDTFNYVNSGYTLKASLRPPILGLEIIGKIGTIRSTYEQQGSTTTVSSTDRNGLKLGLGLRMGIIGEVGVLPKVVVGVEGVYTHSTLNTSNNAVYDGDSYNIDLQGSVIVSKEIMVRLKKKMKAPRVQTGLAPIPEPDIAPEELLLPLCFIPPTGIEMPEDEASVISSLMEKAFVDSGIFKLVEREKLDEVYEKLELTETGCAGLGCGKKIGKELGIRYLVTGMSSKTENGVFASAISIIDMEAVPEKKEDEEQAKEPEKGTLIYTTTITYDSLELAGENMIKLVETLVKESAQAIYDANKQKIVDEKTEALRGKQLEELQEKTREDEEDRQRESEKNRLKLLFIPYGGLKYGVDFLGRTDNNWHAIPLTTDFAPAIFWGTKVSRSWVIGLKFQFMNYLSFFTEASLADETGIAAGVSVAFGL